MAETIKIGGELESTATGNKVADVANIKDKTKGNKSQAQINAELETALEDRYTKSETYSKSELNNMITTPNQEYETYNATDQTTDVTDVLPATGEADTVYRVGNWDGSQFDASVYSEYAWNGSQYVHLSTKTQTGEVFDISAYHATGGTLATYADLSAALDSNNGGGVPQSLQKGGMSVKYVQSSDNKYIRYNLIADEFTTDVTKWAIDDVGVYVENSEFVYVKTDAEGKILWAIKTDGSIYYGAGVPQQVIDYINEKIAELSLDEYEDIVAFLDGLEEGDKTLQTLLNEKVDKEEGKSLIDAEYASTKSTIDNPEFLDVTLDDENKVLEGIKVDGTKIVGGDLNVSGSANIGGDTKILGNMEVSGVSYKVIENPEYLAAWIDAEDKIIFGFKTDGKTYVGDADFLNEIKDNQMAINEIKSYLANFDTLDIDALSSITTVYSPEFVEIKTDSEGKVLAGRTTDGAAFENVGFATPKVSIDGHTIKNIEDPEERTEVTTDAEDKIIRYRDKDGVLHELVGIETNHLGLTEQGVTDLQRSLGLAGFNQRAIMDWSDEKIVEIPLPQTCAILNFGVDSQATSKSDREDYQEGVNGDIPTTIEFWDLQGNYFKKPILLSAQGSSSMAYWIKNQGFDLDDGSTIKFGNWVAQDSFHVKKFYIDVFRGQCNVGYWLTEQIYQTRSYGERRPWNYLNQGGDTQNAIGKFNKDFDTGALAHPDGFPVHVFFNGKDAGIYAFNLKKHRDNYYQKKDNTNQIILDGTIGQSELFGGNIDWTAFEIRNPKTKKKKDGWELVDVNGEKYNGDFPEELMGTSTPGYDSSNLSHVKSANTKAVIVRLSTAYNAIVANKTKATFENYFIVPFFIDYFLISQVLYHFDGFWKNWIWCTWDGELWTPTSYDMDSIFGANTNGASIIPAGEYIAVGQSVDLRTNTNQVLGANAGLPKMLWDLYSQDIKERYAELRNKGIFTTENIVGLLEAWIKKCGYDELKNDIENVCAVDDVPQTPSYRDGSETYSQTPTTGGFYNSVLRVKRWLDEHFAYLDSSDIFNYNQN